MPKNKTFSAAELKYIKTLEIAHAYAEYKTRLAGDLDADLSDWANNIMSFIENAKAKK